MPALNEAAPTGARPKRGEGPVAIYILLIVACLAAAVAAFVIHPALAIAFAAPFGVMLDRRWPTGR